MTELVAEGNSNPRPLDRNDPDYARWVMERCFPNAHVREAVVTTAVESIEAAVDAGGNTSWSVTLFPSAFTINCRWCWALALDRGKITCPLDPAELDTATEEALARYGEIGDSEVKGHRAVKLKYMSMSPDDLLRLRESADDLSRFQQAHFSAISKGSSGRKPNPWRSSYSPGLVAYLREESGRDLPAAAYWTGEEEADEGPDEDSRQVWLFQATPERFNIAEAFSREGIGASEDWEANQFFEEMKVGQVVLLWQSGKNAGIYGVAEITQRLPRAIKEERNRVLLRFRAALESPISRGEIRSHPVLKGMQILRFAQGTNFRVTDAEWEAILELRPELLEAEDETVTVTIESLLAKTLLDPEQIREVLYVLGWKKQIILEGPPGSGKTFVGDAIMRHLTGNPLDGDTTLNDRAEVVQFHPSYGYEDFVQGIRPGTKSGNLSYSVVPGIFMRLCERARRDGRAHVMLIDEINRGNVSRIFGELLYLLEYRDRGVRLPYADKAAEPFSIPENVYIVGTMNTADRSLTMIDYALRRRFMFHRLSPMNEAGDDAPVLRKWLEKNVPAARDQVSRLFLNLNGDLRRRFNSDDKLVGHSYFMHTDIGSDAFMRVLWRWAIEPVMLEYFHNDRHRDEILKELSYEALCEGGTSATEAGSSEGVPDTESIAQSGQSDIDRTD